MEEGWEFGNESFGWKMVYKDLSTFTKVSTLPERRQMTKIQD